MVSLLIVVNLAERSPKNRWSFRGAGAGQRPVAIVEREQLVLCAPASGKVLKLWFDITNRGRPLSALYCLVLHHFKHFIRADSLYSAYHQICSLHAGYISFIENQIQLVGGWSKLKLKLPAKATCQ
ncbi:unnamed protein product [Cladocopium goreaui]|uniref:Uncharacterized protein n=1 Tax=Cladocopium goreaui TaxID=2562237 RepID=A0A9P1BMT8_9DINO|nr:unnamed protein product [Cladocopium goreaui]|mmetsp:Transcript_1595/g.3676  ORF Transcript_1595/g.3676 Transcript_1595/m.3676 type:complete len:126 (-) Transcript_1595:58-435(-)